MSRWVVTKTETKTQQQSVEASTEAKAIEIACFKREWDEGTQVVWTIRKRVRDDELDENGLY